MCVCARAYIYIKWYTSTMTFPWILDICFHLDLLWYNLIGCSVIYNLRLNYLWFIAGIVNVCVEWRMVWGNLDWWYLNMRNIPERTGNHLDVLLLSWCSSVAVSMISGSVVSWRILAEIHWETWNRVSACLQYMQKSCVSFGTSEVIHSWQLGLGRW